MNVIGFSLQCVITLLLLHDEIKPSAGILYPQSSEFRDLRTLDGVWNFLRSDLTGEGKSKKWFNNDLSKIRKTIAMPVPASYNDITTELKLRDHVGTVWYDRKFYVPKSWAMGKRVWIRFGSVNYRAEVYINGNFIREHEFGHLPFEAEITKVVEFGKENRITVSCSNILNAASVPQGEVSVGLIFGQTNFIQNLTFDFFNYAGIHRSVHLYTTPIRYIEDIEINTDLNKDNTIGVVKYKVKGNCSDTDKILESYYDPEINCKGLEVDKEIRIRARLFSKEGDFIMEDDTTPGTQGVIEVKNVKPWWPYLMNPEPGYLYQMEISLLDTRDNIFDVYRLPVGIRRLDWDKDSFKINNKEVYLRGLSKHEDSDFRGRGLDYAIMTRDFNLLKWLGVNCYRTSHYPHSDESLQVADQLGIMIINESPSVNLDLDVKFEISNHESALKQLIQRDHNHPSVIMWSIANAPLTNHKAASSQFKEVVDHVKSLDTSRPVTAALSVSADMDQSAQYLDIISFNSFNGWYHHPGRLDLTTQSVIEEAIKWYDKYDKPVILAEYGAAAVEGFHSLPSNVWSEDYQLQLFSRHFQAFDNLRKNSWFIGEFVWNFADFKTSPSVSRIGSNKKGIFTRNRQPKAGAHHLRKRYLALCHKMGQCKIPDDLNLYVKENFKY